MKRNIKDICCNFPETVNIYIYLRNYLLRKEISYRLHTKILLDLEELPGELSMLLNKRNNQKAQNIVKKLKNTEKKLKQN